MSVRAGAVLTDTFGRFHNYLRISLTERCNLRCRYCMPAEGVTLSPTANLLTRDEISRLARLFVQHGVTKIRLTGGEPTVRKDLVDIVQDLSSLRPLGLRTIAMTTNGIVLTRMLPDLRHAGLDQVNISLDTLDPQKFEEITRRRGHDRVLASIDESVRVGMSPVKVNVVLMRGVNESEAVSFVEMTRERPIEVRFIEFMPFDGNRWSSGRLVPFRDLFSTLSAAWPNIAPSSDGDANATARRYQVPGFAGHVGFVSSMTDHFCSTCNRLRITADGNIKACLFGANEISLRDRLRAGDNDEAISEIIKSAVTQKKRAHAGMNILATTANRPMITIGG